MPQFCVSSLGGRAEGAPCVAKLAMGVAAGQSLLAMCGYQPERHNARMRLCLDRPVLHLPRLYAHRLRVVGKAAVRYQRERCETRGDNNTLDVVLVARGSRALAVAEGVSGARLR